MTRWAFAGALVIAMAAAADGQPPRPGGGGGQPPGGFPAFPGFERFGGLTGQVTSNKDLQAELKITDEQKDKLKSLLEKQAADRQKVLEKLNEDARKEFESSLTSDQRTRLKQIEVQNQGLRAFTTEANAKALAITDTQKTKIKAITDDANKVINETRREGFSGGFDMEKMAEVNKKVQKLTKQAMAEISDTLTPDQQKSWKAMVGEPFDTST